MNTNEWGNKRLGFGRKRRRKLDDAAKIRKRLFLQLMT